MITGAIFSLRQPEVLYGKVPQSLRFKVRIICDVAWREIKSDRLRSEPLQRILPS
jgi:DNA polymerase III psi subunit